MIVPSMAMFEAMFREPIEFILWSPTGREVERGIGKLNANGSATYTVVGGGIVGHVTVNGVPAPLDIPLVLPPAELVTVTVPALVHY